MSRPRLNVAGQRAAAYMKGEAPVEMTDTFERGIEIATRRGAVEDHEEPRDVGGGVLGVRLRRAHLLHAASHPLLESARRAARGYTMLQNGLAPSVQFGLLAASALAGVSERYAAIGAGAEARVKAD